MKKNIFIKNTIINKINNSLEYLINIEYIIYNIINILIIVLYFQIFLLFVTQMDLFIINKIIEIIIYCEKAIIIYYIHL